MWAIVKKEFKQYFLSPIGYIFISAFLLVYSITFYIMVFMQQDIKLSQIFGTGIIILILIPIMTSLLTMRMFAEERKNGTEQLLLTSPRSVTSIVMGKFLAATLVAVISNLLFFMYYAILCFFGKPEFMTTAIAVLGFILLIILYISFGMFASSLVENQIISALISIVYFVVTLYLPNYLPFLSEFSPINVFFNTFLSGNITISGLVLLISTTLMFIIFTIMSIQRRKNVK